MSAGAAVHASCVVVGEAGILLRGASGTGKSTLARRLVEEAARRGIFAGLVGDDRVELSRRGERVVARGRAAFAGIVEARGFGLLRIPHERAAVVRLVVDVGGAALERMPAAQDLSTDVLGAKVPRLAAGDGDADRVLVHLGAALSREGGNPSCIESF